MNKCRAPKLTQCEILGLALGAVVATAPLGSRAQAQMLRSADSPAAPAPAAEINVTPSTLSLGCEGTFTIAVANAGPPGSTLEISALTLTHGYSQGYYGTGFTWDLSGITLPASLPSGATLDIPVTFSAAGQFFRSRLQLMIDSNAAAHPHLFLVYFGGAHEACEPTPTPTATATITPTSCVSDPPLVNPVTSPTNQLVQTITGYSPGLLCVRGGFIEVTGIEVLAQSQNCMQGTFEATVQLQPNQVNDFMVCLRPGLCGDGGCTAVEIVHGSPQPTATDTPTPTPTPTACPDCVLLGQLSVSGPSVDPPHPAVGNQVTFTFAVTYALPGGFDCEHCMFEGGAGYLTGEEPPMQVGGTVVVHRRVVRAGSTTIQLHVRETTEEQCYAPDPVQGCRMFFQPAFIEAASPPFNLQLGEGAFCAGDCDADGEATVAEVVTLVNIALGGAVVSICPVGDVDENGQITIDELILAVNSVLDGCPAPPAFAIRGIVTEFPGCGGYMRGITVVLDPPGLTTQTEIGPDPAVAGTFAFAEVAPGAYTLTVSPQCNPYGCWPPTPVHVVDQDVHVLICNVQAP